MKDTKENILEVATDMFANGDFDSISTRDIAKKAGVNLSAISYYFENKEGLYVAVIKTHHINHQIFSNQVDSLFVNKK